MKRNTLFRDALTAILLSSVIVSCSHPNLVGPPTTKAPQPRGLIPAGGALGFVTLPQNWTDAEANWFYNVPQGSKLIPYAWFLKLEQAGSTKLFRDADNMLAMGYLPRVADSHGNPDGLPIGFVKDSARGAVNEEPYVGFTCAACHTNQLNYKGKAYLIDGAPTLSDAARFQRELAASLNATLKHQAKFDRFAAAIGATDKAKLREQLEQVAAFRDGYVKRNFPAKDGVPFGPGRIDAFGAILNEVCATFAQLPDNYAPADAPVSFPFLWDTPQHDRVQWNGAAENTIDHGLLKDISGTPFVGALGRNVGEVLGVFGKVDTTHEGGVFQLFGYLSSVNRANLIEIELVLRKLWSPRLPVEIAEVDSALATAGAALFKENCVSCHADIKRDDQNRTVKAVMSDVSTDPLMARNFAMRVSKTGVFKDRVAQFPDLTRFGETASSGRLLEHMGQRVVLRPDPNGAPIQDAEIKLAKSEAKPVYSVQAVIKVGDHRIRGSFHHLEFDEGKHVKSFSSREKLLLKDEADHVFHQDLTATEKRTTFTDAAGATVDIAAAKDVRATPTSGTGLKVEMMAEPATIRLQYKGRPLNGIWATGPYLHNGSVRTLDELLKPAAEREMTFHVGSREFDPEHVGFTDAGDFIYDTRLLGNSKAGHEYGAKVFSEEERKQLIAYLKTL